MRLPSLFCKGLISSPMSAIFLCYSSAENAMAVCVVGLAGEGAAQAGAGAAYRPLLPDVRWM